MLCYQITMHYTGTKPTEDEKKKKDKEEKEPTLEDKIVKLNAEIYAHTTDDDFFAIAYKADEDYLEFAVAIWPEKIEMDKVEKIIKLAAEKAYGAVGVKLSPAKEITTKKYSEKLDEADDRDYVRRGTRKSGSDLDFDYYSNSYFKINEELASSEKLDKKAAVESAKSIMADKSLYDELDRIYSNENSRKFYGFPVHYTILSGNKESGMDIVKLLVQMLYSKGRILSLRINVISQIKESAYDEKDLKHICRHADGAAVVIDMRGSDGNHGNYAKSYKRVINFIAELVEQYNSKTLFFFLEDCANPGFSRELLVKVEDFVDRIEIREGTGKRGEAMEYFNCLIKQSSYADLADDGIGEYLVSNRKTFTCYDVHVAFNKWSREVLRNKAYSSYKKCKSISRKVDKKKKCSAYKELQNMIGLSEIKSVTDQIVAAYKFQKIREEYGFRDETMTRHMVFTGNPGSAKTTVARLIADILTEEGILKTGALVECGRADLVGQYVGWTAREVRDKFKEASGGILFIDEAYSLVEDSKSFADEAINTIVQEMENHRGDVIVIFAGYPKKMEEFLDQNEGLRSRIAFHLDFPDYNEDELMRILQLMAKNKGMKIDNKAMEKCKEIFMNSCKEKEFGNGRFVRNLLEQALLKQSQRLIATYGKRDIPKTSVEKLIDSDFDVNISDACTKKKNNPIGFVV